MNSRILRQLSILYLLINTAGLLHAESRNIAEKPVVTFLSQSLQIGVELAVSQTELEQGLMYKTRLDEALGMLFVFPEQKLQKMWMKNTYLALDVLFVNKEGRIVSMLANIQPCRQEVCEIYDSQLPAKYMLELNGGFIIKHSLKIGQQLSLPAQAL